MLLIKPFSSILGVSILIFIGWVFLAGPPSERIDRGCRPIGWVGNIFTSVFAIGAPSFSEATHRVFKNTEYTCQYAIWRLIYEREWIEHQQQQQMNAQLRQSKENNSKAPGSHNETKTTGAVASQGDKQ